MRVRRLDHFGVDVTDLRRAERFYTEVLGMRVEMRLPEQVLLRYDTGACALFLKPDRVSGGLDQIENPLGKSHHAFEVDFEDLARAPALFRERGIPFHAPIDWGDHDCLYFLDPDGNLLELVGYRAQPQATAGDAAADHFAAVSISTPLSTVWPGDRHRSQERLHNEAAALGVADDARDAFGRVGGIDLEHVSALAMAASMVSCSTQPCTP